MSEPIFPTIETDAAELYRIGMQRIADLVPEFDTDVVGSPESWLMEAVSEIASEVQLAASTVPESIFRHFGQNMIGLAPTEGQQSVATVQVVCGDALGHTIDEGTAFLLYTDGETSFEFVTTEDVLIPNGGTTADIQVVCTTPTSVSNGAGVAGVELVDSLPFVASTTIVTTAAGGSDDETEDEYMVRLNSMLQLLSMRPITPRDFETLLRATFGGRWLCLDGYDRDLATWGNALTVTMVGIKDDGSLFTAGELLLVDAFLEANRMVNFVTYTMQPNLETINVSFDISIEDGYDAAETLALVDANLSSYLSPAMWGLPQSGDEFRWDVSDTVRYFSIVNVILNTLGVKALNSVTLMGVTIDHALANEWTLADTGTITGVVS